MWHKSDIVIINIECKNKKRKSMEYQSNNKSRPDNLYRGVVMPLAGIDTINDVDSIKPYHPPKYDENGMPVVGDGNEYGVYMSDNERMVDDVYSNPGQGDGDTIEGVKPFGYVKTNLRSPALGVKYEISPDGLDIREPHITPVLKGHYNNGFGGREWIADEIPAGKYRVASIKVGPDAIHGKTEFKPGDSIETTVELAKKEIEIRMGRLAILGAIINSRTGSDAIQPDINYIKMHNNVAKNGSDILLNLHDYEFGRQKETIRFVNHVLIERIRLEKDRLSVVGEVESGELSNIKNARSILRLIGESVKFEGLKPDQACEQYIEKIKNGIKDETDSGKIANAEQDIMTLKMLIGLIGQADISESGSKS
jgi:hypothetical protein